MHGAGDQSLVGELRSWMLCSTAKREKETTKKQMIPSATWCLILKLLIIVKPTLRPMLVFSAPNIPKPFWKCLSTISKTLTEAHFVTYWLHWIVNGPLMENVDFSYSVSLFKFLILPLRKHISKHAIFFFKEKYNMASFFSGSPGRKALRFGPQQKLNDGSRHSDYPGTSGHQNL